MDTNLLLGADLRHLVALEIVARERSFARAAAQLGYTQSAVSQQIAALERAAGARLLERPRGRGIVEPTEAGALLLRHAERIVASLRAAEADLRALESGTVGSLRVGTFQSVGTTVLPPLLSRYRAAWPAVEVTLIESGSASELVGGVERGELDLTFWALPLPDGPFEILELMLDPHVLLVPSGSPMAEHDRRVSLRELAELPLIGFRHPLAYDAETHLRARGITPRFVFRSDDGATIQGLVASGFAAAIVPRLTVNLDDQRVQARDVGGLIPPRTIVLVRHAERYSSPATQAFQELAHEVCADLAGTSP
jgi:DNA-binding transcriptional LysR family regulator